MLKYNPNDRIKMKDLINHSYFTSLRNELNYEKRKRKIENPLKQQDFDKEGADKLYFNVSHASPCFFLPFLCFFCIL
jgi:serine/threonine protein kinase